MNINFNYEKIYKGLKVTFIINLFVIGFIAWCMVGCNGYFSLELLIYLFIELALETILMKTMYVFKTELLEV